MKASRLPPRRQRAKLIQDAGGVLKSGMIGWLIPNSEAIQAKDIDNVPDYLFKPDANPELSFLVFSHEIDILPPT